MSKSSINDLVLLLALLFGCSSLSHAQSISVGIGDQSTDALRIENGQLAGSLSNYYACAFDKSGLDVEYRIRPQARLLIELETGAVDIGAPLVHVSERDRYATFTNEIVNVPYHLYSRKQINVEQDLSAYTFAVMRSSARGGLEYVARQPEFEEVTAWEQALNLAILERVDGAIIPLPVIERLPADKFENLNRYPFGFIPASMYVSNRANNAESITNQLNLAISQCVASIGKREF